MMCLRVTLAFRSYWLADEGAAPGQDLDAQCYRDADGCPAMPMTQVKGTLREAALRLGWDASTTEEIFGAKGAQAKLAWRGDARLPEEDRLFFSRHPAARAQLFRVLRATKIDDAGAAAEKSLRAFEAAVPMTLEGVIGLPEGADAAGMIERLNQAGAAALAFGKLKSDGFGRAICEVAEAKIAGAA